MTPKWVVRTCKVVEMIERSIPQLILDMHGSQYADGRRPVVKLNSIEATPELLAFDNEDDSLGWRGLLCERLSLIRTSATADSYRRRLNSLMNHEFMMLDADIADAICIALGLDIEMELKTYPNTKAACEERIRIEWEMRGKTPKPETIRKQLEKRWAKYQAEMYPNGKLTSPAQLRDREYRRAKRAAARAAA
jgi:hypothetical protein